MDPIPLTEVRLAGKHPCQGVEEGHMVEQGEVWGPGVLQDLHREGHHL